MKPLIIYHDNCADGFGAAFAAWMKFGDGADYLPWQYTDSSETLAQEWYRLCAATMPNSWDRDVYILDFSFRRGLMEKLFDACDHFVWLDHHKSAFEMWCGEVPESGLYFDSDWLDDKPEAQNEPIITHIVLDNNKSGAMLAWEYFHPDTEVPMLIKHIDDYDRWQFKIDGTKAFNKALWSYAPWTFEQWRRFLPIGDLDNLGAMKREGEAILRAHEQNVQAVVKRAGRKCCIEHTGIEVKKVDEEALLRGTSTGLAANCPPHLASDVGHQLALQSGTYGLLWYISKDGECLCSLRSNGDYDVSAIAKAFGGGGHKNAAGFTVEIETLLGWIR